MWRFFLVGAEICIVRDCTLFLEDKSPVAHLVAKGAISEAAASSSGHDARTLYFLLGKQQGSLVQARPFFRRAVDSDRLGQQVSSFCRGIILGAAQARRLTGAGDRRVESSRCGLSEVGH